MAISPTTTASPEAKLESSLLGAIVHQDNVAQDFDTARGALRAALVAGGMDESEADNLVEAFERSWYPGYGDATGGAPDARRGYDAALRGRVGDAVFTRFVGALRQHRQITATANRLKDRAYSVLGPARLDAITRDSERLNGLRGDIEATIRAINPDITPKVVAGFVGEAPNLDPVRRTATIALDPLRGGAEAYEVAWSSIEHLLTGQERAILMDAVAERYPGLDAGERPRKLAEMFAEWAAPQGHRKPDAAFTEAIQPVSRFFIRVKNLARGHGFRSVDDIWRSAERGEMAARNERRPGLRVEPPSTNAAGHERAKAAIEKMTVSELAETLERQNAIIYEARREARPRWLKLPGKAAASRRLEGHGDLRQLLRARAMLEAERRRRLDHQYTLAADHARINPDPGPSSPDHGGPGPGGPAPRDFDRPSSEIAMNAAWRDAVANDNPGGGDAGSPAATRHVNGGLVDFEVVTRGGEGGKYHVVSLADGPSRTQIATFRNDTAMPAYLDAFDRANATGGPSMRARELAARASSADRIADPAADLDTIRNSGLLDARLDSAVASRDMLAYVYPLKSGDLLWQTSPGQWQAGTLNQFKTFAAERHDPHLANAAEAITAERQTDKTEAARRVWLDVPLEAEAAASAQGAVFDDRANRWYAPDAAAAARTAEWRMADSSIRRHEQMAGQEAGGDIVANGAARQVPPQPPAAPAVGAAAPGEIKTASDGVTRRSFTDTANAMGNVELIAVAQETAKRLGALRSAGVTDADSIARKVSLTQEMTVLGDVLKQRGIDLRSAAPTTHAAAERDAKKPRKPKRAHGAER